MHNHPYPQSGNCEVCQRASDSLHAGICGSCNLNADGRTLAAARRRIAQRNTSPLPLIRKRSNRAITRADLVKISRAEQALKTAQTLLRLAGVRRAHAAVTRARKSTQGAVRHARRGAFRMEQFAAAS
jgi:succinate dehydrogenase/fumarate reductase-like Fe-S protein